MGLGQTKSKKKDKNAVGENSFFMETILQIFFFFKISCGAI